MKNSSQPDLEIDIVIEEPQPPITLDRAKRYFRESVNATQQFDDERRLEAGYYHNQQIPERMRRKLRERGQPETVTNFVDLAVSGVLGYYDNAQTDPKCEARSPEQQDAADIATKILRFLNDRADTKTLKKDISKDFFLYGTCAMIVEKLDEDIAVNHIPWSEFFYDPASVRHDFSDASYLGIKKLLDASQVRRLYPEAYKALGEPTTMSGDSFSSKGEEEKLWFDITTKRVRIVELYFRDNSHEWQRVVFCEAGFLDFGPSVYLDDRGRGICPIIAASFEVNAETRERYGPIMALRPLQDAHNARSSALLNETQNRRIRQTVEGIDPKSKILAKQEIAKADGVLPYGWDVVTSINRAQDEAALLQITEAAINRRAPSTNMLSQMRAADSGRARQILLNAGLTEWARGFGFLEKMEETMNRHLWFAAKQFMTQRQQIRVTGEARDTEWIEVNVPVGAKPVPVMDPQTGQPVMGPDGMPQIQLQPVLERAVAEMDVDIVLDSVPDTVTLQQEANEQILKYAEGLGLALDDPRFRLALELFLTVDKKRTLEKYDAGVARIREQNQAQQQMQQQLMQMQQQLEQLRVESEAAKDAAQARKATAEAEQTEMENAAAHAQAQAHADAMRHAATLQSMMQPTQPPQLPF